MDNASILAVIAALSALAGIVFAFARMIIRYLDIRDQYRRSEQKIKKTMYTRDAVANVAKIILVVSGPSPITPENIRLAKQVYYGVMDDYNNREIISDFDERVTELITKRGDSLRDEIRRNTLLPIAGITSDD